MGSIYDNEKYAEILDAGSTSSSKKVTKTIEEEFVPQPIAETKNVSQLDNSTKYKYTTSEVNDIELQSYQERAFNAMKLVDDIVLKNYLTQLVEALANQDCVCIF